MPKRPSSPTGVRIRESATFQSEAVRLDRPNAVLHDVKFIGWISAKKRRYKRKAVESAALFYDGAKVNLDHAITDGANDLAPAHVKPQDRFGRLRNIRVTDEGGFADLHYNPEHAWAKTFEWFAENDPGMIGLSHDAVLEGPMSLDGSHDIERIAKVYSVDIVADPGTTRGLHESAAKTESNAGDPGDESDSTGEDGASLTMRDLNELENDDEGGNEHREKIAELIRGYVCDSAIDTKQLRDKVLAALNLLDDEDDDSENTEDTSTEGKNEMAESTSKPEVTKTPATESAAVSPTEFNALREQVGQLVTENQKLREQVDTFRARESLAELRTKATKLCNTAGLPEKLVTEVFINRLTRVNESEWENEIADRKLQVGLSDNPISSGRGEGAAPTFEQFEKFALTGGTRS